MKGAYFKALALLGLAQAGCTFYTACPTPASNQPQTGGNGNSGGSSSGGGGNMGGSSISVEGGAAPAGEWRNETFNLAAQMSECGNVSLVSVKPNEDLVIAGIAQLGLFGKSSDATEWTSLGEGKESAVIRNRTTSLVYDPDYPEVFWESGIYNLGGVYRTDDDGDTFVELGATHNDAVTVDFTDPKRRTLLATGHEQVQTVVKSTDRGITWTAIGMNLPSEAHVCGHPLIIDTDTYLLGCGTYGDGKGGIFRSEDGGDSWQQVNDIATGALPKVASDGTIYWPGAGTRGMVRSHDQGQTWQGPFGAGELLDASPTELPDGKLAALGGNRVIVSGDGGETWSVVSSELPYSPSGLAYSPTRGAFYIWHWTCEAPVPNDAIMAYDFDWQAD